MSVQLWNFKDGPKVQDFCPRINMLKGFFLNNPTMNYGSSKSAKIVLLYDTSRNGIIGTQKGCIENGESFHTSVLSFFMITLSARLKE